MNGIIARRNNFTKNETICYKNYKSLSYNRKKVFVSHIIKVDERQELFHHIAWKAMKRMDTVDSLLLQLEQYGEEHDRNKNKGKKLRNVSREMGQFYQF